MAIHIRIVDISIIVLACVVVDRSGLRRRESRRRKNSRWQWRIAASDHCSSSSTERSGRHGRQETGEEKLQFAFRAIRARLHRRVAVVNSTDKYLVNGANVKISRQQFGADSWFMRSISQVSIGRIE